MKRISEPSGDAADDILNNNPILKNKLGGSIDQLKDMGDQFGPEAKKIVDKTWKQVQDILKGDVGVGTADQLRRLIQDKTQEVRKLADQAWQKGLEQAKPYLDYSPKVRELVMQNKETLMQGNLAELWEKVRVAAKSGDTGDLKKFIRETADRGKGKLGGFGGGLDQYFNLIPGGSEIIPKFQAKGGYREAWGGGGEAGQGGVQGDPGRVT